MGEKDKLQSVIDRISADLKGGERDTASMVLLNTMLLLSAENEADLYEAAILAGAFHAHDPQISKDILSLFVAILQSRFDKSHEVVKADLLAMGEEMYQRAKNSD